MQIDMPLDRFMLCELAAGGYGSLRDLMHTRADVVCDAFDHLRSMREYESRFHELNAPGE
jgi:hypothetical protein